MSDDLNPIDRDAMIRTVIGEAGNQGPEGMAAVAQSILNRLTAGRYGNSPAAVVLAPGQYEPWQTRRQELLSYSTNSPAYQKAGGIVDAVAAGDIPDSTNGSTHFLQKETVLQRRGSLPSWASKPVAKVGAHTFFAPEGKASHYDAVNAINDAIGEDSAPSAALAFSDDDRSSPGGMFRAAGFAAPGDKKTAPDNGQAVASPSAPGSMFKAAGFVSPGSPQEPQEPAWKEAEARAGLEALGIPTTPVAPKGPGRGMWQATKDYVANIPHAILETIEAPGNIMASGRDYTSEELIPTAVGLAGLAEGTKIPKVGPAAVAEKLTPTSQAVNKLVEAIGPENVPAAVNRLTENPRLTLADVSDPVRTMAQGLIDPSQPKAQNAIVSAVKERAATRLDAANSAFTEAMGPKPDVMGILDKLRERALMTTPKTDVRAALDDVLGRSIDPHTALQKMLKEREAANPLYEKALSNPVQWDERLQQFIDDPIVKSGIAKGVRIQRLESLAENKPFNPNDYAIKEFNEAGDPVLSETPNMRTLNVVKKGLDAMVEDSKDGVTGRLSEEGRAIDSVRKSFLKKLDDINPDYKAARQAWAGPTKVQEAFNQGLNIFQNRSGSSGINTTPEALSAWFGKASQSEQEAAKLGARSAFEQQMRASSDPASKAGVLANKEVNQAKLGTIFGKEAGDKIVQRLNFEHEDPIHAAFDRGFDILKNRSGVNGLGDRPEALHEWMKTATPEQVVATRLGVRADIDQKINSVKNGALKGETITAIPYNQEKLRALFGDKEANRLIRVMKDSADESATNAKMLLGSKTAETLAGQRALAVPKVGGGNPLTYVAPVAAEMLGEGYGLPGVGLAATTALKGAHMGVQKLGKMNALARNAEFAKAALASGTERNILLDRLMAHPKVKKATRP
jgi:hypothetical protein